jgi:hypothetical protein
VEEVQGKNFDVTAGQSRSEEDQTATGQRLPGCRSGHAALRGPFDTGLSFGLDGAGGGLVVSTSSESGSGGVAGSVGVGNPGSASES